MHELFVKIIDKHRLTVKELAADTRFRFHVLPRQIYRYMSGDCEIPLWVWQAVYDKTKDVECLKAITGSEAEIVVYPAKDENYRHALRLTIDWAAAELEKVK